jgi:NADH-quinone oxidoreductase subunit F
MLERIRSGEATPMDLDIMASVQEQIIGHCLCVLGDAMAMPIGSMIEKFREELEAEIEAARERADAAELEHVIPLGVADEYAGRAG